MKKLVLSFVAVSLLIFSPNNVSASGIIINNSLKGYDLLNDCNAVRKLLGHKTAENIEDVISLNNCHEFIRGVINTNDLYVGAKWVKPNFCIPEDAKLTHLALIVLRYLEQHPEELNFASVMVVHKAFTENFPCPKSLLPK